jgi:hypothetical protein
MLSFVRWARLHLRRCTALTSTSDRLYLYHCMHETHGLSMTHANLTINFVNMVGSSPCPLRRRPLRTIFPNRYFLETSSSYMTHVNLNIDFIDVMGSSPCSLLLLLRRLLLTSVTLIVTSLRRTPRLRLMLTLRWWDHRYRVDIHFVMMLL